MLNTNKKINEYKFNVFTNIFEIVTAKSVNNPQFLLIIQMHKKVKGCFFPFQSRRGYV
jgi:hypothetical protein